MCLLDTEARSYSHDAYLAIAIAIKINGSIKYELNSMDEACADAYVTGILREHYHVVIH